MPKVFKTYNPATGALIKEHQFATAKQVSQAIESLHEGFLTWRKLSFKERQKHILPCVEHFKNQREILAKSITEEMGKPYFHALGEIDKAIQSLEYMCTHDYPEFEPLKVKTLSDTEQVDHQVFYKPKGVILGVMPWNFPFWQAVRMVFPTLLMGNTVLLKHSEITPSTGDLIKSVMNQLEFRNIFEHLIFEHEMTESIIADPRVHGVSLTGSVRAGETLSALAGKYMKKGVFELGGSDAYLILDDANLEKTATVLTRSRLQNTGQSCIAAKRVLVSKKNSQNFIEQIKISFDKMNFGDLSDKKTMLGPLAHAKFIADDESRFQFAKKYCDVVYEKNPASKNQEHQAYVPVRILKVKDLNSEFLKYLKTNEFFSPTLLVFEYDNLEQALELVNGTNFGLGGGIFSENLDRAKKIAMQFDSGMVAINESVRSDVALPFGGVKSSGMGREMGILGFYEFSDPQVITTNRFN